MRVVIDAGGCTVVRSPALAGEWQRYHQSTYARRWLHYMIGRKRTELSDGVWSGYADLLHAATHHLEGRRPEEVAKDVDVVAAAFATDHRVVSLDRAQAVLLTRLLPTVAELAELYWADPTEPPTNPWLAEGAPVRIELTLRHRPTARPS
jgi:hypothetical protein